MKIITLWHARLSLSIVLTFFVIPITFVLSYAFEHLVVITPLRVFLVGGVSMLVAGFIFSVILYVRYPRWSKQLKLNYRKEYAWTFLVTGFGLVGTFLMLDAFLPVTDYFLLIIIPLVIIFYYGLYQVGKAIYKVPLFMRNES